MKSYNLCLLALLLLFVPTTDYAAEFEIVDSLHGLAWGEFEINTDSGTSKSIVYILRIDPDDYEFQLLSTIENECEPMSVRGWCEEFNYEIGFNAGMYTEDNKTTVGYCRNYDFVINDHFNMHNSVFAFNPKNNDTKPLSILDRQCDDFDVLKLEYHTLLQSIRMIGCDGGNVWKQSDNHHSILAMAEDESGNLLLIFTRTPLSVHDFIDHVLTIELKIKRMMYLEGSTPAGLHVNTEKVDVSLGGVIDELYPLMIQPTEVTVPNVIVAKIRLKGK